MVGPAAPNGAPRSGAGLLVPVLAVVLAVVVVALAAAFAFVTRHGARPPGDASAAPSSIGATGSVPGGPGPVASLRPAALTGEPPRVGSIAAVGPDGGLTVIGPDGRTALLTAPGAETVGFPAWSPDGSRLAAISGRDGATTVEMIPVGGDGAPTGARTALYASDLRQAFYVAWLPGGRAISLLANDADLVDLRVVDTDRTAPLDGADAASLIRKGAPLYFDWLDDERALLHVGVGDRAFLALVGRDGHEIGADLERPGDFRSAPVSVDGRFVAYTRATSAAGEAEVIVAPLVGGDEIRLPTFGPTALTFSPTGDVLMAIGADRAELPDMGFPMGPLRTIDAPTGRTRTLVAGAVVGAFWSPDGRTILALRLQVAGGASAAAGPRDPAAAASPVPSEVHALIVDVASGAVPVDHVVRPGPRLVSEILPYFDQYALSHRLWAPDSSSFLLPVIGNDGTGTVIALPRDGSPSPFSIAATAAFWSP